jgi:Yip1 domain
MSDSAAGRLLGALVAPVATFRSIAARPTWLLPLLLLVVVGAGVGSLLIQRMDFDQIVRAQNERTGGQMTAEQVEQAAERAKNAAPLLGLFEAVVSPVIYLLVALAFWTAFRLLGSDITYKASFATALHALLPSAIALLLSIPVILRHGTYTQQEVKGGSFLASSLAALAPADASPAIRALLGSFDLFSLWALSLLVIGYRETARVSRQAAIATVIALWLVYVVGKVALAALLPG